jgi:acyl dehydratase
VTEKLHESGPTIESVSVGDVIPTTVVPVTATLIVAGAIASQDRYAAHHDRDFAVAKGTPDIFMNILTTNGLSGRYLTDWAGPDAVVLGLAIKLGVPNFPGDEMTMTGEITGKDEQGDTVTVSFSGENARGKHVTGHAEIRLREAP